MLDRRTVFEVHRLRNEGWSKKKIATTLKDHLYGILSYCKHPITNAMTEGINSRIETLRKAACGFRNKQRLRTVILFHLGGLDLYPVTH